MCPAAQVWHSGRYPQTGTQLAAPANQTYRNIRISPSHITHNCLDHDAGRVLAQATMPSRVAVCTVLSVGCWIVHAGLHTCSLACSTTIARFTSAAVRHLADADILCCWDVADHQGGLRRAISCLRSYSGSNKALTRQVQPKGARCRN